MVVQGATKLTSVGCLMMRALGALEGTIGKKTILIMLDEDALSIRDGSLKIIARPLFFSKYAHDVRSTQIDVEIAGGPTKMD